MPLSIGEAAALWSLFKYLGVAAVIFVILLISWIYDNKRWADYRRDEQVRRAAERQDREKERKAEDEKRERDRAEHMAKWETMIRQQNNQVSQILASHTGQVDRAYTLLERQTAAIEMQGSMIHIMGEQIKSNQFCPLVRKETANEQ